MLIESTVVSIIIQIITGIIDYLGLKIPVEDSYNILKEILLVEFGVQLVELAFYIWLVYSINSLKNITIYRYFDWFITTPVMLVTLMAYLSIEDNKSYNTVTTLAQYIKENKNIVIFVVILNVMMLLCGFLSELYPKNQLLFVILGFLPFIVYFYAIYEKYIKNTKTVDDDLSENKGISKNDLFYYFVIIWSLYGVAAFMPYIAKNVSYNILDLFAKNFFGVFLVYLINSKRKINT